MKPGSEKTQSGELPFIGMCDGWDSIDIRASSLEGTAVLLGVRKLCEKQPIAEVTLYVKLADGSSFKLPRHPDKITCFWEDTEGAWSAGGLKIQVLDPEVRLRIIYNGPLTNEDGDVQHVQFNFIWSSATKVVRHPEDWSKELAVPAIISQNRKLKEKSRGKFVEGSWMQWGVIQGRFQSFDQQGISVKNEYLRLRGTRERSWTSIGYDDLRRSVNITATAKDGTMVHLRGLSYNNIKKEGRIVDCIPLQVLSIPAQTIKVNGTKITLHEEFVFKFRGTNFIGKEDEIVTGKCICTTLAMFCDMRFNELQQEITDSIKSTIATTIKDLVAQELKIELLHNDNNILRMECTELRKQVNDLTQENDKREQWVRRSNIEIVGIPMKQDENLVDIVSSLARACGCNINPAMDIDFVTRVAVKSGDQKRPKPIIVKFQSRYKKDDFISSLRRKRDLNTGDIGFASNIRIYVNDHLTIKKRNLSVTLCINSEGGKLLSGVPYQQELVYRTLGVDIDDSPGTGILEIGCEYTGKSEPTVRLPPPRTLKWLSANEVGPVGYCLPFEARAAACPDYVGGKGASLALLASVQDAEGYKVPPGFCLTIQALEKHLDANLQLVAAIRDIEAANEDYNEAVFKDKCTKAVNLFVDTEITADVRNDILAHLVELRNATSKQNLELRFAVRSSAVGEDSETLSAAGQNETILGCSSDEDVVRAVQKCWGSMFAFTSAYYRRQNGQACRCGGGVVVQALAGARVAGVMFTRHPDRGDASRLLLTANYGLGETVVSGSVEPDTIIVKRDEENLAIMKVELGSKSQRVTAAFNGVATEDVPETERGVSCLSEIESLKLAQLGVRQEELWGAGRDIEWAIAENGTIYLLQARPITSLERWTEEELLHEMDTPIMSDEDLTTFANTGEVLPKPLTPLSMDFVCRPMIEVMSKMMDVIEPFEDFGVFTYYRTGIALYNTSYRHMPKEININVRMGDMALHGRKVADQHILETALRRRPAHWTHDFTKMKIFAMSLLTSKGSMKDSIKIANKINIQMKSNEPLEMLNTMLKELESMKKLSYDHSMASTASSASQIIAMSILLEGAADFTSEHTSEINTLLSSGDVLSAEVPQFLAKLSLQLEKSGKVDEFKAQDPKEAMHWLSNNLPNIHKELVEFLKVHGHRAIMEFDMYTKPWVLVPHELMKILQNLKVPEKVNEEKKTDAEIIASLTTPKKSSTRTKLSTVLPLCHRTVRHRESTKAHLILGVHKMRLAALEIGKELVRRWYLPNEDVVFFFLHKELREYITNRDPALLRKAIQRQQYYPMWCKFKFAEINTGWVDPLPIRQPAVTAGDVQLEATSVCGGEVIARACVVKDLSEIHQLHQGDVLITYSTDIGWSPYFPLLTGIVTELGGLISHGAVIAREYGLPCIVGAMDATNIFKTGDIVRLSGTKGLIEKVQVSDKFENEKSSEAAADID
ncbi:putative phosphotransferase YvkC [Aphomia sociella]